MKSRNFRPWLWLGVLACLCFGLVLSACGVEAEPQEPVTIKFVYPDVDDEYYQSIVTAFQEEYSYITVELEPVGGRFFDNLGPGDADVFAISIYQLGAFLQNDGVLGLNPLIEADTNFNVNDYLPGTLDLLVQGGETWGIPIGIDLFLLYYNHDLFDQAGVIYPTDGWTWDSFLNAALAITGPEDAPDPVWGYCTTPGYSDTIAFVYANGGTLLDDLNNPTRVTFDDPETMDAMKWYTRLYTQHNVAPAPQEINDRLGFNSYIYFQAISVGNAGMWILPASSRGGVGWPVPWQIDWGAASLPHDQSSVTPVWVNEVYMVSAASQNPTAAWKWLSYLSQQMHPRSIPARNTLLTSTEFEDSSGTELATAVRSSMQSAVPFSLWQWVSYGEALGYFNMAVEQMIEGEITTEDALLAAQENADLGGP